jgi:hypothetical protein
VLIGISLSKSEPPRLSRRCEVPQVLNDTDQNDKASVNSFLLNSIEINGQQPLIANAANRLLSRRPGGEHKWSAN